LGGAAGSRGKRSQLVADPSGIANPGCERIEGVRPLRRMLKNVDFNYITAKAAKEMGIKTASSYEGA